MENYENTFNNICRLCLRYDESNKNTSLVDSNRENGLSVYGEYIKKITSSNIDFNDDLPKNICFNCKNELKRIEGFKTMCKINCERLNLLLNHYYKNSSDAAKMEAAIHYSMFTQYFPDKYQKSYLNKVKDIPFKSVKEKNPGNVMEAKEIDFMATQSNNKKDTVLLKEENVKVEIDSSDTVVPKIEKVEIEIDCNDANYLSEPKAKMDIVDSFLQKMENIFTKTIPKRTSRLTCSSQSKTENIDLFLDQMENIFTKTRFKPKTKPLARHQPITCTVCNRTMANKYTYQEHMQSHGQYLFICDQCGKGYPTKQSLDRHLVAKHRAPSSYECDSCSFKCSRRFDLVEHIRLHTGERPFTCEHCGLTFRRKAIYTNHRKCHDGKTVQCPRCPQKFYRLNEVKTHINNAHERMYLYLCPICKTSYAKSTTVRKHMVAKHGISRESQGKILRVTKKTHKDLFKENK